MVQVVELLVKSSTLENPELNENVDLKKSKLRTEGSPNRGYKVGLYNFSTQDHKTELQSHTNRDSHPQVAHPEVLYRCKGTCSHMGITNKYLVRK